MLIEFFEDLYENYPRAALALEVAGGYKYTATSTGDPDLDEFERRMEEDPDLDPEEVMRELGIGEAVREAPLPDLPEINEGFEDEA